MDEEELEELKEKVNKLEKKNDELNRRIETYKRDHSFDMQFINKQINVIAAHLNIKLEECDLHVTDIDLSINN